MIESSVFKKAFSKTLRAWKTASTAAPSSPLSVSTGTIGLLLCQFHARINISIDVKEQRLLTELRWRVDLNPAISLKHCSENKLFRSFVFFLHLSPALMVIRKATKLKNKPLLGKDWTALQL